jgi:hypothetical protein
LSKEEAIDKVNEYFGDVSGFEEAKWQDKMAAFDKLKEQIKD